MPDMFGRQAEAARRCRAYVEDAYGALDYGPGPLRNGAAGIINYLADAHDRIRGEVTGYFRDVQEFTARQGDNVHESVEIYETTDMDIAAMMDASLFLPERRQEARELGRSTGLDPDHEITSLEPKEPVNVLKPLTDYRAQYPFQPEWMGTGRARDTIWQVTYMAHQLGLMSRPVDIVADLLIPFTGDWAGLKSCGDALTNAANATRELHTNVRWLAQRVDAVWQGNVADACWLHTRKLESSLSQAPTILDGYAAAYEDVVAQVFELEKQAAAVLAEALDWGIAALFGRGAILGKVAGLFLPPASLLEFIRRIFVLLDLVQQGIQAVWDFEARVELGVLHGPYATDASLPPVPAPAPGYT